VGISGGKDSYTLLHLLKMVQRNYKIPFELIAVHISNTALPYRVNTLKMGEICDKINVPFHLKELNESVENRSKSPCFYCSWVRRKEVFLMADELNANKIAYGHHLDDVNETLIMNMIVHGTISAFPASKSFFDGKFDIIRPLILISEPETIRYSEIYSFPDEEQNCEFEERNLRDSLKGVMNNLYALKKNAKINLFRSMSKIDTDYLPDKTK